MSEVVNPTNVSTIFDKINYFIDTPDNSVVLAIFYVSVLSLYIGIFVTGTLLVSVIAYSYPVYIIYTITSSYIDKIKNIPSNRLTWLHLIEIRNKLERNLNAIPFLAMSIIFLQATTNVVAYSSLKTYDKKNKDEFFHTISRKLGL